MNDDMSGRYEIDKMVKSIRALRKSATELKKASGGIQAVECNADRILASVRMLEINVSDVEEIIRTEK